MFLNFVFIYIPPVNFDCLSIIAIILSSLKWKHTIPLFSSNIYKDIRIKKWESHNQAQLRWKKIKLESVTSQYIILQYWNESVKRIQ